MSVNDLKPFKYKGWSVIPESVVLARNIKKFTVRAIFEQKVFDKVPNDYSDYRTAHLKYLHRERILPHEMINEGYDLNKCVKEIKAEIDKIGEQEPVVFPKE